MKLAPEYITEFIDLHEELAGLVALTDDLSESIDNKDEDLTITFHLLEIAFTHICLYKKKRNYPLAYSNNLANLRDRQAKLSGKGMRNAPPEKVR